jgi:GNAT superfamily N-acetyltransferase
MRIKVTKSELADVFRLRDLYQQEMNCQIIFDAGHERGFSDVYSVTVEGRVAGYGAVGSAKLKPLQGTVMEFYVLPAHRPSALTLFHALLRASRATQIQSQTNDTLLTLMLYDCARNIQSRTILFHDARETSLTLPGVTFRKATKADASRIFPHKHEPVGDWVLESKATIVATGGVLFHYNRPYGDIFMEVSKRFRRRGLGSYLVQELKRTCYELGSLPAARCNESNIASRKTLEKAGFAPCARILTGTVMPALRSKR